jgi:hypothetical protein
MGTLRRQRAATCSRTICRADPWGAERALCRTGPARIASWGLHALSYLPSTCVHLGRFALECVAGAAPTPGLLVAVTRWQVAASAVLRVWLPVPSLGRPNGVKEPGPQGGLVRS